MKKFVVLVSLILSAAYAHAHNDLTFYGRVLLENGQPDLNGPVLFHVEIRSPGTEDCLLYEKIFRKDLSDTDGYYSLTIPGDEITHGIGQPRSVLSVFSNVTPFILKPGQCAHGTTFEPKDGDSRKITINYKDGDNGEWHPLNFQTANAQNVVPLSVQALMLGGFQIENVLRVVDNSGRPQSVPALSSAQYVSLISLINGSTNFGTVTDIETGAGLTGGPITTAGTIALAQVGTGGTGTKVNYDVYGRVTGGTALIETDLPVIQTPGKVVGDAINFGTIGGSTAIATSGNVSAAAVTAGSGTFNAVRFAKDGGAAVTVSAPAGLSASYGLTWPANVGNAGQFLIGDGSGGLGWGTPPAATPPIGNAGGDLSGFYPNPSVAKIQGVPVAGITPNQAGETLKFDGGSWTAGFIGAADVRSRMPGSAPFFPANCGPNQTFAYSVVTDTLVCATIAVPDTQVHYSSETANFVWAAPDAANGVPSFRALVLNDLPSMTIAKGGTGLNKLGSANQVLGVNAAGDALEYKDLASGTLTGLSGDVTASGTGVVAATVVAVGGSAASDLHKAEILANASTASNLANSIVRRDASGGFSTGNVSATNVAATGASFRSVQFSNAAGSSVIVSAPTALTANYALTWPASTGNAGQFLIGDGTGRLSWGTPPAATPPIGNAGGDLSGSYPNPSVAKLQGVAVAAVAPNQAGQTLKFDGQQWTPGFMGSADIRSSENGNTVFAGPDGASGLPTFRSLNQNDLPVIRTPGKVLGDAITSGTIGGATSVATSGSISSRSVTVTNASNAGATIRAPSSIAPYTLTLPSALGTAGQVLATDSSGNLSWVAAATMGLPAFTGDVTTTAGQAVTSLARIRGTPVAGTTPTSGEFFKYDGTNWVPAYVTLADLSTTTGPGGQPVFPPTYCQPNQTFNFDLDSHQFVCRDIGAIDAGAITSGALDIARLPVSVVRNGGNMFGDVAVIGTLDNYPVSLQTNATSRLNIMTNGNVGVGVTLPTARFQVGSKGDGSVAVANAWNTFSDARLKNVIGRIPNAGEMVDQLNGYYFTWKDGHDQGRQVGVLAQEIEKVLPELVKSGTDGIKTVDYPKLTAVLIEALKDLRTKNAQMAAKTEDQERRLRALEAKLR